MAINTGVDASKLIGYTVLGTPEGIDASKLVSYAVLDKPLGVSTPKLIAYAVLGVTEPSTSNGGTFMSIG